MIVEVVRERSDESLARGEGSKNSYPPLSSPGSQKMPRGRFWANKSAPQILGSRLRQEGGRLMARRKHDEGEGRRRHPARTSEGREMELAAAAYDLAEEQIRGGNASSQVITHFLKMGSSRERLEQERMAHEIELMEVKKQQIENQAKIEDLFTAAIDAMRSYTGSGGQIDPGDED